MMTWLRKIARRLRGDAGVSAGNAGTLPQDICDLVANGNHEALRDRLQQLRESPDALAVPSLLEAARRAGWSQRDIDKLEIFADYYRGRDLVGVFQRSAKYASPEQFDADLFTIAVFSLYYMGRYEDAWRMLHSVGDQAQAFDERSDHAMIAALISKAANHFDDMKRYIDKARRLDPTDSLIALNAYGMYFELGDMPAFEMVERELRRGDHVTDQAGFALAIVDLARDDYIKGFQLLELRYQMAEARRYLNPALFSHPRWRGESLVGKSLLISAEQGLGDTVQMSRFLPAVRSLMPKELVVAVQSEALSILQNSFPDVRVVPQAMGKLPEGDFDLWVGLMSLPHLLGITAADVPAADGYVTIPPDNLLYWRQRVGELSLKGRLRIGLAWSGNPMHRNDLRRSIPFATMMEAVERVDADFFALQTHVPAVCPKNVICVSEELVTLADTAALIGEMDLVISVDTSIVHLAGAIGKETWLLLPYRYEWRWGLHGESNHWYSSVRVLRQRSHGSWGELLDQIVGHRLPEWRHQYRGN